MYSFKLDSLSSKELQKDVLVRLVHGKELTLNYFELKNKDVNIAFHTVIKSTCTGSMVFSQ